MAETNLDILEMLECASLASCTCRTKSPDPVAHAPGCHFRVFQSAYHEISILRSLIGVQVGGEAGEPLNEGSVADLVRAHLDASSDQAQRLERIADLEHVLGFERRLAELTLEERDALEEANYPRLSDAQRKRLDECKTDEERDRIFNDLGRAHFFRRCAWADYLNGVTRYKPPVTEKAKRDPGESAVQRDWAPLTAAAPLAVPLTADLEVRFRDGRVRRAVTFGDKGELRVEFALDSGLFQVADSESDNFPTHWRIQTKNERNGT